jgi:hypothetical protein
MERGDIAAEGYVLLDGEDVVVALLVFVFFVRFGCLVGRFFFGNEIHASKLVEHRGGRETGPEIQRSRVDTKAN